MKKIVAFLVLALALGTASAQHRGNYSGHNNGQYHNGGQNYGRMILGTAAVVGTAVLLNSIFRPQAVIIEDIQQPLPCQMVPQRVVDPRGRPLYDQYTGQPLVRLVQVCPAPVMIQR